MSFKMKSKADVFGYSEELSNGDRLVYEKDLEGSVMGEANKDGTTFVSKDATPKEKVVAEAPAKEDDKEKAEAVSHEDVHHEQMTQGRLGYTDSEVWWKNNTNSPTKRYKREKGNLIAMDGSGSDAEGGDFPWEEEAWRKQ